MDEEVKLSLVLLDILRGYSILKCDSQTYYFKHFLVCDNLKLDEFEFLSFQSAVKNGIKSEKDLITQAIHNGFWSNEKEEQIKNLKWLIEKSTNAYAKITDNIQKKAFENSLDSQKQQLSELLKQKSKITDISAETFASNKRIAHLLKSCIFYDESLTKVINEEEIAKISSKIGDKISCFSNTNNLIRAAYHPSFFDLYCIMYRNPYSIFEKNIFEISVWQKSLLVYASILLNKLKSMQIPDDIKVDAIKLYNFTEKTGETSKVSEGVDDLRKKMIQNKGKLTAEDLFS